MNPPTSVKVIGMIGLLWGGIAALILAAFTAAFAVSPVELLARISVYAQKPLPQELYNALADPAVRAIGVPLLLAQLGLYGALCWGSWRLLRLQEIGRKWVLGCALAMILWEAGTPLINRLVEQPIAQKYNITLPERRGGFHISMNMLYAGAAWFFLTRPTVRRAFQ